MSQWVKYLHGKGCRFNQNKWDGISDGISTHTILFRMVDIHDGEAMMSLLKCGYQNIYAAGYRYDSKINKRGAPLTVTPLGLLTILNTGNSNYDNTCIKMFIDFVEFIMTNVDQFGGEARVLNHIIDTNAAKLILTFDKQNKIRQHLIQLGRKHHIDISRKG